MASTNHPLVPAFGRARPVGVLLAGILVIVIGMFPRNGFAQRAEQRRERDQTNIVSTPNQRPVASESKRAVGIAVVELFTSQGCSSCPPADAALRQIDEIASKRALPVYALSFHVDYWNRLGWKDPYSNQLYSKRQSAYAAAAGTRRVYTPQMIVNGTTEFVGSNRAKAHAAINRSLGRVATSKIEIDLGEASTPKSASIRYHVTGDTEGSVLNIAIVQSPRPNRVPAGENSGRELSHVNVVRAFQSVPLTETDGDVSLQLPNNLGSSRMGVIAYVQNIQSLAITGATLVSTDQHASRAQAD